MPLAQQIPRVRKQRDCNHQQEECGKHKSERANLLLKDRLAGGVSLKRAEKIKTAGDTPVPPRSLLGVDPVLVRNTDEGTSENLDPDRANSGNRGI